MIHESPGAVKSGAFRCSGNKKPNVNSRGSAQKTRRSHGFFGTASDPKRTLPPDRKEWACQEIKAIKKEIGKLDREIQRLTMEERFKR
jgi:hypothetical protein